MGRLTRLRTRPRAALLIFLCGVMAALFALSGCKQWDRMEENQVKLQAMVAANARQLATVSSQLHVAQGRLDEGIQKLDEDTREVAAGVRAVQGEQVQLRDTVVSGNQKLDGRMTELGENQESLNNGVAQVAGITQRTAADVTALGEAQAALHQSVRSNQQELTGSIGAVANNQQRIQTGIADLQQGHEGLAGSVAALAGQQDKLHQTMQANHSLTSDQLAALAAGHDRLGADLANVHALGQTISTDLAGVANQQSALQESLGAKHQELSGRLDALAQSQQDLRTGFDTISSKADRMDTELVSMNSSLRQALRDNHETLTGQVATSLENQQALQAATRELGGKMEALAADLRGVATTQTAVQETTRTNHDAVVTGLTNISENQAGLRSNISGLNEKADAIAASQEAMGQTLRKHGEMLDRQAVEYSEHREALQDQLDILTATIGQTALDIVAFNTRQAALQQTVQAGLEQFNQKIDQTGFRFEHIVQQHEALRESVAKGHDTLSGLTLALTKEQQTLATGVEGLRETMAGNHQALSDQMATGLTRMASAHAAMNEALRGQADDIRDQTAGMADMRADMQAQFDVLTATTGQTALDMMALDENQTKLAQAVRTGMADLGGRMGDIAGRQEQTHNGLDIVTATAGQTQLDIINMAAQQNALHQAVQSYNTAAVDQVARLADQQQQIQNGLDILTATAGQTQLDIIGMAARQNAVNQALQNHDATTGAQMARLADSQQQIQGSLDTVKSTTGQAALDVGTLNNGQTRLEQAMQAGRDEMMSRLAEIAQGQQNWLQRFDAAQANVDTMARGIAALEQQVAQLHGTLQTSIQELTAHLDAEGQQRLQLEAKVAQDLQAMIESIAQLRQTQTSLQEQMAQTQVQRSTPTPTRTVEPAPEPTKEPAAEVKVSDATPAVEPPMAEATK